MEQESRRVNLKKNVSLLFIISIPGDITEGQSQGFLKRVYQQGFWPAFQKQN